MESTVVLIFIPPPSFQPVPLSLPRSHLFQNTHTSLFFNPIKYILTSFYTVLGKDVMDVPATKRPSKRFRILGHAIHFDASTVSRESTESSFNVSATSSEKKLLHHNSILDLNAKHLFKMEKTMGELTSMLQNVKAH